MHGLVALDAGERVLRPAILWNDQRTAAECREIEERIGLARLLELTGNRALPGFTAPKLLWLRTNEPETYERIAHILLPKDYVRLALTGERATDVADASGTLLFDVAAVAGATRCSTRLELPEAWLPPALESPSRSAEPEPPGVPVAAGAGDQAAGALGVGVTAPGPVSGRARHVGRRLRHAPGSGDRRRGARACLLPRRARRLARDGRDALGGRGAPLVPGRARPGRAVRDARRRGRALGAGRRGPPLPALPRRRADAACRPGRPRRLHRPLAPPRPRSARARRARGRRLRSA